MGKRMNNRGSALVLVIIIIAFVSILVVTLFSMTLINIQMKSVDRKAKENFYSAEGALEQINLGLQDEISTAASDAYTFIMQNYASNTLEIERRNKFNNEFLDNLQSLIQEDMDPSRYKKTKLESYLSTDVAAYTEISSTEDFKLVKESDSLVLKGLVVTYINDENYESIIETDIRLTAPNLNLIQPSDMPDIFDYSIIASENLKAGNAGDVTVKANVYAGENGFALDSGAVWRFNRANRLVVAGDIRIPAGAYLTAETDLDLWAQELQVTGGNLTTKGRAYVANDLVMSQNGSDVVLDGEYYGYGNGDSLTDAGLTLPGTGDASAILINGRQTSLDMSGLRRLLISGSAQIATGSEAFTKDDITTLLPENTPSMNTQLQEVTLAQGLYSFMNLDNNKYVSSGSYLSAGSDDANDPFEQFYLYLNASDQTISLMDKNTGKYVSVQQGDVNEGMLAATADTTDTYNERFKLYSIVGASNRYALKSMANGKFVSIDRYYDTEGNLTDTVLFANRDKVTDEAQLFKITRLGDVPVVPVEYKPMVTFTHNSSSVVVISFADPVWMKNNQDTVMDNPTISYSDWGTLKNVKMELSENKRKATVTISTVNHGLTLDYTITYKNPGEEEVKTVQDSYTHNPGLGNSGTGDPLIVNGVYRWQANLNGTDYTCKVDPPLLFWNNDFSNNEDSWEKFIIVNNEDDGTISIKDKRYNLYVAIQEDGSLSPTSATINDESRFNVKYIAKDVLGYYQLYTLSTSSVGEKLVYVNMNKNARPLDLIDENTFITSGGGWQSHFYFEWLEYTKEVGAQKPEPVITPGEPDYVCGMEYESETSAKASFTTPAWTATPNGETVNMTYSVNDGDEQTVAMTRSGKDATYIVPGLKDKDKVTYSFTYTYYDTGNVLQTATTESYIYIHETRYGSPITIHDQNENVNLGESVEVKSNQIAYLVPPELIGVNEGVTFIGRNPMSATDFAKLMSYANNWRDYPNFEIVSFTKETEKLGKSLAEYRTAGTDGYKTVFVQTTDGTSSTTMVYFYVDFDSDNSSAFFRDYYKENKDALNSYMDDYINEITLSSRFTRLTTDGNMVFSTGNTAGSIDLKSNVGNGAYLTESQRNSLENEETGYMKRFEALSRKLMLDYGELTQTEKVRSVFDNLLRYSEIGGAEDQIFAYIPPGGISYTASTTADDGKSIKGIVLNNSGEADFYYNDSTDPNDEVCMIIATGNVVLEKDFSGIVIARGTVTVADEKVNLITGNKANLYKLLQTEVTFETGGTTYTETIIEHFFRDGNLYVLDTGDDDEYLSEGDYISYAEQVTYEGWTKR